MSSTMGTGTPVIEVRNISKSFGTVVALHDVSMAVAPGKVTCLLGDNGAGKSTLIKVLSGVHRPDEGTILFNGEPVEFRSPRDPLDHGIATVFQDLAMVPLMSIARNFYLGREPRRKWGPLPMWGPLKRLDLAKAAEVTRRELHNMGIDVRDTSQTVATLSGGERQSIAIARAVHFGARVLILDEPTSALGVREAAIVLRYIVLAKRRGLGVVFITHNIHHAFPIGDAFTVLSHGRSLGTFAKGEVSERELETMMAGGTEMDQLAAELTELLEADDAQLTIE